MSWMWHFSTVIREKRTYIANTNDLSMAHTIRLKHAFHGNLNHMRRRVILFRFRLSLLLWFLSHPQHFPPLTLLHLLAVVEYDGAVGPAVVVDQTQVWEQTHADGLQPSLIAHHKPVTVDLRHMEEVRLNTSLGRFSDKLTCNELWWCERCWTYILKIILVLPVLQNQYCNLFLTLEFLNQCNILSLQHLSVIFTSNCNWIYIV